MPSNKAPTATVNLNPETLYALVVDALRQANRVQGRSSIAQVAEACAEDTKAPTSPSTIRRAFGLTPPDDYRGHRIKSWAAELTGIPVDDIYVAIHGSKAA